MADYIKVGEVQDFPSGSMKQVMVGGIPVAISNIDGEFFAIGDICTHEHCSLSGEGFLDGNVITCGCHGAQFDVTTGKVLSLPATEDEPAYKVRVDGGSVYVLL